MDEKSEFTLHVCQSDEGKRLDVLISDLIRDFSRSFVSNLIKCKCIRVDDQIKKPGYRVKKDDRISIEVPTEKPCGFMPEALEFSIIYEDENLIVIDKPPGLVVHPSPGHPSGTLVNGLLHHCPDLKRIGDEIRPGIVHRLDKDTSGILVVAKDAATHRHLSHQFKERIVKKEYIALVFGEMSANSGKIDLPIGRHPLERKKMSTASPKGREAETLWSINRRFQGFSLINVHLKTGRTHQIRVHFFAIRHPIVGDSIYSGKRPYKTMSNEIRMILKSVNRQMLHAYRITFHHPRSQQLVSFEAPVPLDMSELMNRLRTFSGQENPL